MAIDQELERHREMWLGFTKLMKWSIIVVVITLAGMAAFLI
jgi:hypothetical protein